MNRGRTPPLHGIVAEAVERERRVQFLDAANADFEALKKRSKEWRVYLAERRVWEGTLKDGLVE